MLVGWLVVFFYSSLSSFKRTLKPSEDKKCEALELPFATFIVQFIVKCPPPHPSPTPAVGGKYVILSLQTSFQDASSSCHTFQASVPLPIPVTSPDKEDPLKIFSPLFKTQLKSRFLCKMFPGFSGPHYPITLAFHYILPHWKNYHSLYFFPLLPVLCSQIHISALCIFIAEGMSANG